MLFVERSNRTERLLEGLADRLTAPTDDPLKPSLVVVQGPGMERWVAQSIARRSGVCANVEFAFPRQLLERLFEALPGEEQALRNSGWDVSRLTWSVARLLSAGRGEPDFAPLARHLEAVDGDGRIIQLSRQIAVLLDQYVTFRPEWIRDWSRATQLPEDRDARWQARLVRDLASEIGPGHLADRSRLFLDEARRSAEESQHSAEESRRSDRLSASLSRSLPSRIEIFAVSTLPPLFLSVIDGLARCVDVHLSILSPTQSYWADLWREVRDGDLAESAQASGEEPGLFDALPATPAARLLVGLGRLGGEFQRCLEDQRSGDDIEIDAYASPLENVEAPSLLARLQSDLLDLDFFADAGEAGAEASDPSRIVSQDDDSIQIHFCHGPRRELEVVEAALREAFEQDPTLAPEDVIVMAPQIDAIAAEIEAVFGVPQEEGKAIPFRIADRGALKRSPVAETFRSLLDLLGDRAARSELLDWLNQPPARERFDLEEEGVERLAEWAERAGIRFGLDEAHRESLGLPRERKHTWADGLERLALAHATGASADVFEGAAPEPLDPFSDAAVLGSVGEVQSMLAAARVATRVPRRVGDWCSWLSGLLERSTAQNDANAHEHTSIRGLLQELSASAADAGFEEAIPFEAIREQVSEALASSPAPQAFLAGGVTFSELVPLRAIPFKVIAILGLSDGAFPRGRPALSFDLMARARKPGDRSTRSDDRYLFLEALLSARDRLILTVPGQDVRDGSDLPPSIVISELLDAISDSFALEAGQSRTLREALVIKHPLQGFSARYFEEAGDPRLVSRDAEAFQGAMAQREATLAGGGARRRFLDALASEDATADFPEARKTLTLDDLVERMLRATRWFTRDRLRLRLPRTETVVSDLDPHELAPLDRFTLGAALLDDLLAGATVEDATERLMARAVIPAGVPGRLATRRVREEVIEIARLGAAHCSGEPLEEVDVAVELDVPGLGKCVVTGRVDRCFPKGRVQVGFGRVDSRGEFDVWIRHLFLCAAVEDGLARPAMSTLVGRAKDKKKPDQVVVFEEVAEARTELARLFEWAWSATFAPLPFFPKASREFAEQAIKDKYDQAWRNAHQKYHGGESNFSLPESEEELEHARLWEGMSPLDVERDLPLQYRFDEVAEAFFAPLFRARRGATE